MPYLTALPTFLAIFAFAILGFLVVHNQHKLSNRLFVVFLFADSLWLTTVLAINFTTLGNNIHISRLAFAAAVGLTMSIQAFTATLLGFRFGKLYKMFVYGYGSLLIFLIMSTDLIVRSISSSSNPHLAPLPIYGLLFPAFLVYLIPVVFGLFLMLLRRTKVLKNQAVTRQQLGVVSVGIITFVVSALLTNLILPTIFASTWPSQFAPLGSVILASSFFYAIGRYKLFDIHFFVVRAGLYIASFLAMTFLWVTPLVLVFAYFHHFRPSTEALVITILLSVVATYMIGYLRSVFDRLTSKIFFRYYYNPQDVLDRLGVVLVRTVDEQTLEVESSRVIQEALKSHFVKYLLLASASKKEVELIQRMLAFPSNIIVTDELDASQATFVEDLRHMGIAAAVKLSTTHEDLGFIALGYKLSGQIYSDRDRRLLGTMAGELAISLQNALRFKEIQRFNVTLQEQVDRATYNLRRANKRLEELDETKDDFISMASHQLRTPLTSVKGYLSMVLEGDAGKLSSGQDKMLGQAFTSAQRMVYLITDLLNVSRLRTGKFVINAAPVNLSDLIAEEVLQLIGSAELRKIKLTYNRPSHFPMLMMDETKMRQVVMNFIDNAIYYTHSDGHIRVELTDNQTTVELRVVDDGIGVPKGEQHHLFTKFYRAANARKVRPDGTGLGLFMAKKVVVAQGGSIIFSSRENKGSTFGFVFSKSRLQVQADSAPNATAEMASKS